MTDLTTRDATTTDVPAMLAIYRPFVTESAVSFELEAPSVEEFGRRVADAQSRWAWLVAEGHGGVAGYAYAGQYKSRAAYRWSVETAVYVHEDQRRDGVGRALYERLFEALAARGHCTAYAGITVPNEASASLHRALGFTEIGVFRRAGWKFGRWHDVSWAAARAARRPAPLMAAALGPRLVPAGELDDATRGEIVALCELAFREDFSHFFARLPGATHVLLRDECGALLSHVCWVERGLQPRGLPVLRAAYVEAMATHPDRQREGHGTAVLRFLVDEIRAAGGDRARRALPFCTALVRAARLEAVARSAHHPARAGARALARAGAGHDPAPSAHAPHARYGGVPDRRVARRRAVVDAAQPWPALSARLGSSTGTTVSSTPR